MEMTMLSKDEPDPEWDLNPIWQSELVDCEVKEISIYHINCPYCGSSYSTFEEDYTCKHCGEDLNDRDVKEEVIEITLDTKAGIAYTND